MRFATSCFDKTIFRTDWRRYWPIAFFYTAFWTVAIPLVQWTELRTGYEPDFIGDHLYETYVFGMGVGAVFACAFAVAAFSYLMNGRSVGFMHALPVTRGSQFVSHIVAVLSMMAAGKAFVAVLTALVHTFHGAVAWQAIAEWFLAMTFAEFFYLALAILCCVVTGWLLAVPVVFGVANCVAIVLTELVRMLGDFFYFGYAGSGSYPEFVYWLTPMYRIGEALSPTRRPVLAEVADTAVPNPNSFGNSYVIAETEDFLQPRCFPTEGLSTLAIYTVIALGLLALSYFLYTRRPSESAGDPVAFPWLRPIVGVCVTTVGGLAMGELLYMVLSVNSDSENFLMLCICIVVMAFFCHFAAQMVIQKKFRVFTLGQLAYAVSVTAVLLAVCIGAKLDITGYQQRLPQENSIQEVQVNVPWEDVYARECKDPETIAAVLELHQAIIDEGRPATDRWADIYAIRISYDLVGGGEFNRNYNDLDYETAKNSAAIRSALEGLLNSDEVRYTGVLGGLRAGENYEDRTFRGGYLNLYGDERKEIQLTADQASAIYAALLRDLENGAGQYNLLEKGSGDVKNFNLELETSQGNNVWLIRFTPDFTETVAELAKLELTESDLFYDELAAKYGYKE